MPKTDTTQRQSAAPPIAGGPVRETRFDPAHEVAREAGGGTPAGVDSEATAAIGLDDEVPLAEVDAFSSPELLQQFRLQAQQLVEHLQARQRELDARESELHSQLAKQDAAARNARLWFRERHHELTERQSTLDEREAHLATAASQVGRQQQPLDTHFADVVVREAAPFPPSDEPTVDQLRAREAQLDAREKQLQTAETLLVRGQIELESAWQQLDAQRQEFHKRMAEDRQDLANQRRQADADLADKREALGNRATQLEVRAAAVDRLRVDVLHMQRQALELRLATEELWARMAGSAPPAALTRSLAQVRSKLAEHFRLQIDEIAAERRQVEELAAKISAQHERLAARKQELDHWLAGQHRGIEAQSARLVGREKQLDEAQERTRAERRQWDCQRRDLEREIRGLHTELRRLDCERA